MYRWINHTEEEVKQYRRENVEEAREEPSVRSSMMQLKEIHDDTGHVARPRGVDFTSANRTPSNE